MSQPYKVGSQTLQNLHRAFGASPMVIVDGWLETLQRRWSAFGDTFAVYEAIVGSRVDKTSSASALTTSQMTCYHLEGMISSKREARHEITSCTASWTRSAGI